MIEQSITVKPLRSTESVTAGFLWQLLKDTIVHTNVEFAGKTSEITMSYQERM
jgi:hypothetical protein